MTCTELFVCCICLQTQTLAHDSRMDIDNYQLDDEAVLYYTGLKSYNAFIDVLASLGSAAYCLNYLYSTPTLSVKNQFFLTLIRLRRYKPHFELSRDFDISLTEVSNIITTWVRWIAGFLLRLWFNLTICPNNLVLRIS